MIDYEKFKDAYLKCLTESNDEKENRYTFFIAGVSDGRLTYYAIGCKIGEKPNYSRIQKRMGERFFADYYSNDIKKSFKSYDSLKKFCDSLRLSSDIPTEKNLISYTDKVYYIQ